MAEPRLTATGAADRLLDEIERAVVGKRSQLRLVLAGLLAGGHVLLDDVPGVAKTLAARSLATAAGLHFARVQFNADIALATVPEGGEAIHKGVRRGASPGCEDADRQSGDKGPPGLDIPRR